MKDVPVTIVGAGPSGLVLGLSLAQHGIHSIILERDLKISEDPRGVFLAADAVRILCQLGFQDQLYYIGEADRVRFHKSDFRNKPFFEIPTRGDWLEQVVPAGFFQIQPRLEACLQDAVVKSPYCDLHSGCNVTSREELGDGITIHYDEHGEEKAMKTSWLVGADGKTGVVRKKFLEPTADIKQVVGLHEYTGTWVAANLKITLPTPESHPELPVWKLGLSSEEVFDLFWPKHWHFCNPPGKATATGRFGPREARLWRHEFAEPEWNDTKDATELLWEHLTPMITKDADNSGRAFEGGSCTFPRDCIEVQRCRLFTFTQKVVNKWFHDRTILIGDAAHVFPPFGGQGIACGLGDADSLAWRLAILHRSPNVTRAIRDNMLQAWSTERRKAVDDSTKLTLANGTLCNEPETWTFYLVRHLAILLSYIPGAPSVRSQQLADERTKYQAVGTAGFFLPSYAGGGRIAQVYVKSASGRLMLSDHLLRRGKGIMTILVLNWDAHDVASARTCVANAKLPSSIISGDSVVAVSLCSRSSTDGCEEDETYQVCSREELRGKDVREGYNARNYMNRFPKGTKYTILRPDLIVFAACSTISELVNCVLTFKNKLEHIEE